MSIEEEIVSLCDSRIYRAYTRRFGYFKVRVVGKTLVCEFGGFENVLRDAGIRAIPI